LVFFFQAEDGIRDWSVTGVQTCALPIWLCRRMGSPPIVARAQSLLASVRLSSHLEEDDRERIAAMLAEAGQCARELGPLDGTARVERLQRKLARPRGHPAPHAFPRDGDVWIVR